MKTHYYTCPCCGFKCLEKWFNSQTICHICYWQNDDYSIFFPLRLWANFPFIDDQKKILAKIPEEIREFDWYFRHEKWSPLSIEKIKYPDIEYIEKWYYESEIKEMWGDSYYQYFLKAQKYNPSDN
jgi:hypothetical protein